MNRYKIIIFINWLFWKIKFINEKVPYNIGLVKRKSKLKDLTEDEINYSKSLIENEEQAWNIFKIT